MQHPIARFHLSAPYQYFEIGIKQVSRSNISLRAFKWELVDQFACYIVNDKFTQHIKQLILTENIQEIINSGYCVLKEVNLLHGNGGICSKINVNFHHFFLPLFNDFELRIFIA